MCQGQSESGVPWLAHHRAPKTETETAAQSSDFFLAGRGEPELGNHSAGHPWLVKKNDKWEWRSCRPQGTGIASARLRAERHSMTSQSPLLQKSKARHMHHKRACLCGWRARQTPHRLRKRSRTSHPYGFTDSLTD